MLPRAVLLQTRSLESITIFCSDVLTKSITFYYTKKHTRKINEIERYQILFNTLLSTKHTIIMKRKGKIIRDQKSKQLKKAAEIG